MLSEEDSRVSVAISMYPKGPNPITILMTTYMVTPLLRWSQATLHSTSASRGLVELVFTTNTERYLCFVLGQDCTHPSRPYCWNFISMMLSSPLAWGGLVSHSTLGRHLLSIHATLDMMISKDTGHICLHSLLLDRDPTESIHPIPSRHGLFVAAI